MTRRWEIPPLSPQLTCMYKNEASTINFLSFHLNYLRIDLLCSYSAVLNLLIYNSLFNNYARILCLIWKINKRRFLFVVGPLIKVCTFPGHRPRNIILGRSRSPPNPVDRERVLNEIFNFLSTKLLTEEELEAAYCVCIREMFLV